MWIEFSDGLMERYPQPNIEICAILEEIAKASWQGWHAISASTATLKWLSACELSLPSKAAIKRAFSTVSERAALAAVVKGKLVLVANGEQISREDDVTWNVPIEMLKGVSFARAVLLTENIRDGKVLMLAGMHFRTTSKIRNVNFSLQLRNGGGADIAYCLEHEIHEKNFPIVVTDGDFDYPECGPSMVSNKCDAVVAAEGWIAHHQPLPCREIENFIPVNLANDAIEADLPNSAELNVRNLQVNTVRALRPDVQKFADLKDGTRGFHATNSDVVEQRRSYWAGVAKDVRTVCSAGCGETCARQDFRNCDCRLLESIGGIVPRVLDHCDKTSPHKQLERARTSSNYLDWLAVGERIFSWGVADLAIRA